MILDDEKTTAYHEAGHAVMAYDLFGSGASAELTIQPDEDYLGAHSNSPEFKARIHKLVIFVERGIVGLIEEYDEREEIRLNHQCDQMIALFIAGHAAEEVFCDIPNDPTSDDWKAARDLASRLDRGTDIAGEYDLTSYFTNQRSIVKELLDGKYRHGIEALVEQVLEKKNLTGVEVTQTIEANLS